MPTLRLNGTELSTYGWDVKNLATLLDGMQEVNETFSPPSGTRTVRSEVSSNQELPVPLQLYLPLSYSETQREAAEDALNRALKGVPADWMDLRNPDLIPGEVAWQVGSSSRKIYTYVRGGPRFEFWVDPILFGSRIATIDLVRSDPGKYEDADTVVIPNSTPVFVDCGTLPSWWQVECTGATNPQVVVYRDESGVGDELFRVSTSVTTGGDTLLIDQLYHRLLLDSLDISDTGLPEDFGYFLPLDAGDREGVWVQLTSGSGSIRHRPRWR